MRGRGARIYMAFDHLLTVFVLAAACLPLPACGRTDTVNAVHVDALPHLTAEAGPRIGDFEDPTVGFTRVAGVDVDRDGLVYVLEASVPEIRVYNTDGMLLRRMGRRGAGPGEFDRAPPRFGVLGDTVWAVTLFPARITLFDRGGNVLSARRVEGVTIPLPRGSGEVLPWSMRPDGTFTSHFAVIRSDLRAPPTDVEVTDSIPVPFVLFDPTGAVTDTIGWAGRPPPRMWRPYVARDTRLEFVEVGGHRRVVPAAPPVLPWWLPVTDGYILVDASAPPVPEEGVFTVTRFGLSGDTVYSRAVHYRPSRYSDVDLDSIAAWAARGDARGMSSFSPDAPVPSDWETIAGALRARMEFPEFKGPIENAWLAQDESTWLRLNDAADTSHWLVVDGGGHLRGVLDLPSNAQIQWHRGDTFWAVVPDEFDVQWLVRYRIQFG